MRLLFAVITNQFRQSTLYSI